MQRTQIYLPKELRQQLAEISADTGESLSELLRKGAQEIISQFNKLKRKKKTKSQKLEEFFAKKSSWETNDFDVMAYRKSSEKRRNEHIYERKNNN